MNNGRSGNCNSISPFGSDNLTRKPSGALPRVLGGSPVLALPAHPASRKAASPPTPRRPQRRASADHPDRREAREQRLAAQEKHAAEAYEEEKKRPEGEYDIINEYF